MATFTVSIPDKLKKQLAQYPEVNWPEFLKKRLEIRLRQFQKFQEMVRAGKI